MDFQDHTWSRNIAVGIATKLWVWQSGVQIPEGARPFLPSKKVQTGSGAQRRLSLHVKQPWCGVEYRPSSRPKFKISKTTLLLPSVLSWREQERLCHLLLNFYRIMETTYFFPTALWHFCAVGTIFSVTHDRTYLHQCRNHENSLENYLFYILLLWQENKTFPVKIKSKAILTLILLTWRKWWAPNNASK